MAAGECRRGARRHALAPGGLCGRVPRRCEPTRRRLDAPVPERPAPSLAPGTWYLVPGTCRLPWLPEPAAYRRRPNAARFRRPARGFAAGGRVGNARMARCAPPRAGSVAPRRRPPDRLPALPGAGRAGQGRPTSGAGLASRGSAGFVGRPSPGAQRRANAGSGRAAPVDRRIGAPTAVGSRNAWMVLCARMRARKPPLPGCHLTADGLPIAFAAAAAPPLPAVPCAHCPKALPPAADKRTTGHAGTASAGAEITWPGFFRATGE
jgi:hypothetical protein